MAIKTNKNPNLKHNATLYEKRLLWGVPSKLMVLALAFVFVSFFSAGLFPAIIVFLITIPPLIIIHKNDDQALTILFDKLKRPDFHSAGGVDEKMLKVIRKRREVFEILNISEIQK